MFSSAYIIPFLFVPPHHVCVLNESLLLASSPPLWGGGGGFVEERFRGKQTKENPQGNQRW